MFHKFWQLETYDVLARCVVSVAKMANYIFLFQNGIPEDQIVDLQDDSTAVEEGLKTVSGMIRDLSLPGVGRQFHSLEVRQESGQQVLKIEFTATRAR